MLDRRRYVRYNLSARVTYTKLNSNEEKEAISKNIADGGICLVIDENINESELINFKIYLLKDTPPIKLTGKVVWSKEIPATQESEKKKFCIGTEFVDIDKDNLKIISTHLEEKTNKQKRSNA